MIGEWKIPSSHKISQWAATQHLSRSSLALTQNHSNWFLLCLWELLQSVSFHLRKMRTTTAAGNGVPSAVFKSTDEDHSDSPIKYWLLLVWPAFVSSFFFLQLIAYTIVWFPFDFASYCSIQIASCDRQPPYFVVSGRFERCRQSANYSLFRRRVWRERLALRGWMCLLPSPETICWLFGFGLLCCCCWLSLAKHHVKISIWKIEKMLSSRFVWMDFFSSISLSLPFDLVLFLSIQWVKFNKTVKRIIDDKSSNR